MHLENKIVVDDLNLILNPHENKGGVFIKEEVRDIMEDWYMVDL
jgi:hypothetical protein